MKIMELLLASLNEKESKYISLKEIIKNMKEHIENIDINELKKHIQQLITINLITEVKNNRYKKIDEDILYARFYYSPKDKGHGIAAICTFNKEEREMLYIENRNMHHAMHEDLVVVKVIQQRTEKKRANAKVLKVIKRNESSVIGTFVLESDGNALFISDNQKYPTEFQVDLNQSKKAEIYDRVIAKVINTIHEYPSVKITDILGFQLESESILKKIIEQHELRDEFPLKVLQQAEKLDSTITSAILEKRTDYRDKVIFTIDGEDAKDLDDAVSIERLPNGHYRLGVHIADVAHYVKENSRIDKEAYERGTSVYLINTVLPMLPQKLSNGLCSLTPNTDKLTLSVTMDINEDGNVINSLLEESIIRSVTRLNYGDVTAFLNGNYPEYVLKEGKEVTDSLELMNELTYILMEKRNKRGTIDFDFPEAKIILNDDDMVESIKPYERGIGNQLIEEFMIVCNETVSEFFHKQNIPFVYRVHEKPSEDRIEGLRDFLEKLGYNLPDSESIEPKHLQSILKDVEGKANEKALQLLILQVMKQARYSDVAKGHFGLATKFYSHFTSPIRRYPDLMIHRILKSYINKSLTSQEIDYLSEVLNEKTKTCSKKERIAERAENELRLARKLEYMLPRVGETYEATITSMSNGGFSVILPNTVEGFVPLSSIGGNAKYDESLHQIHAKDDFVLLLGQAVTVELTKVKIESKEIIFKYKTSLN